MLYIQVEGRDGRTLERTWHVGEPLPPPLKDARVVKFQADGDELEKFIYAMHGDRVCKRCGVRRSQPFSNMCMDCGG